MSDLFSFDLSLDSQSLTLPFNAFSARTQIQTPHKLPLIKGYLSVGYISS